MLKLIRLDDDRFMLMTQKSSTRAKSKDDICVALRELDIDWKEIEDAMVALQVLRDDVAEFGVNKTFMFTHRWKD